MILKKLTLILIGSLASANARPKSHPVNPELELIITSPRVVNSPLATYPGSLSFGRLIETNYGKELAPSIVRSWILSYTSHTKVDDQIISPREDAFQKIIQPWLEKDGFIGENLLEWSPNLANAPLKLLAVVNRQDIAIARSIAPTTNFVIPSPASPLLNAPLSSDELRRLSSISGASYYISTRERAGEIRFVFCLTGPSGIPLEGGMTVILENNQQNLYTSNHPEGASSKASRPIGGPIQYIAARWHALGRHKELGDDYLKELDALVTQATTPLRINKPSLTLSEMIATSPLLRIRTNDNALGEGREFRQFDSTGKTVMPTFLSASLADAFCDPESPESRALAKFYSRKKHFPLEIEVEGKMTKLSTASSLTLPGQEEQTAWSIRSISREHRRHISMNSCIGCHGKETNSDGFHIAPPNNSLLPSLLSKFLSDTSERTGQKVPHSLRKIWQPGELARRIRIHDTLISPRILNGRRLQKLIADSKIFAH